MRASWGWAFVAALAACSSEESSSSGGTPDAAIEASAPDAAADTGPIVPATDGGCDGSVPGLSAGAESQCAGKQGQAAPGSTGAAPGAACSAADDCQAICCTCTADAGSSDAGATFVSAVSVCGCGNVCATAQEACAFYEKTYALCQ
jgi:hypothetical protein